MREAKIFNNTAAEYLGILFANFISILSLISGQCLPLNEVNQRLMESLDSAAEDIFSGVQDRQRMNLWGYGIWEI